MVNVCFLLSNFLQNHSKLSINFICFINKSGMRNSFKPKLPLSENNTLNKHHNHSLKSLDTSNRLKSIIESSQKIIATRSTRNAVKLPQKGLLSPKYFKQGQSSVQNRLKLHENKQNVKLPFITKSKIKISQEKPKKKLSNKSKVSSGKKLITEPIQSHFLTISQEAQRQTDIKQSLLQILDSNNRKSISIEAQINKLSQITKKGTNLRKHLRTIQQDMLSLNLKKKLSKISQKNQLSLLDC